MRGITTWVSVLLFRHIMTVKCIIRVCNCGTICCFCTQPSLSHYNTFPELIEHTVAEYRLDSNHSQTTAQCAKKETFCSFVWPCWQCISSSVLWWSHPTSDTTLQPSWVPPIFSPVMTSMAFVIFWKVYWGPELYVDRHGLAFEPKPCVTSVFLLCGCHVPAQKNSVAI